jgi:hypothetical protein
MYVLALERWDGGVSQYSCSLDDILNTFVQRVVVCSAGVMVLRLLRC